MIVFYDFLYGLLEPLYYYATGTIRSSSLSSRCSRDYHLLFLPSIFCCRRNATNVAMCTTIARPTISFVPTQPLCPNTPAMELQPMQRHIITVPIQFWRDAMLNQIHTKLLLTRPPPGCRHCDNHHPHTSRSIPADLARPSSWQRHPCPASTDSPARSRRSCALAGCSPGHLAFPA